MRNARNKRRLPESLCTFITVFSFTRKSWVVDFSLEMYDFSMCFIKKILNLQKIFSLVGWKKNQKQRQTFMQKLTFSSEPKLKRKLDQEQADQK